MKPLTMFLVAYTSEGKIISRPYTGSIPLVSDADGWLFGSAAIKAADAPLVTLEGSEERYVRLKELPIGRLRWDSNGHMYYLQQADSGIEGSSVVRMVMVEEETSGQPSWINPLEWPNMEMPYPIQEVLLGSPMLKRVEELLDVPRPPAIAYEVQESTRRIEQLKAEERQLRDSVAKLLQQQREAMELQFKNSKHLDSVFAALPALQTVLMGATRWLVVDNGRGLEVQEYKPPKDEYMLPLLQVAATSASYGAIPDYSSRDEWAKMPAVGGSSFWVRMNQYRDGSGSYQCVIPFSTQEEALARAAELNKERLVISDLAVKKELLATGDGSLLKDLAGIGLSYPVHSTMERFKCFDREEHAYLDLLRGYLDSLSLLVDIGHGVYSWAMNEPKREREWLAEAQFNPEVAAKCAAELIVPLVTRAVELRNAAIDPNGSQRQRLGEDAAARASKEAHYMLSAFLLHAPEKAQVRIGQFKERVTELVTQKVKETANG